MLWWSVQARSDKIKASASQRSCLPGISPRPDTKGALPMTSPGSTGSAKALASKPPLSGEELRKMHAYWRAANYLSVGQIYLYANPLLQEPLKPEHIKPRLLGHWGTTPGLNFIYVHFNRLIKKYDLNVIYIA